MDAPKAALATEEPDAPENSTLVNSVVSPLTFPEPGDLERVRPGYAEACNNMGDALKDQGDHAAAIDAFQRAIEIKPGYAEAYNNIGVTLQEQRKFDETVTTWERRRYLERA